ncbi:MAG: hypothetical protein ACI8RD_011888 [Bacillariaceae sp.]|jgi:hypothetical protein
MNINVEIDDDELICDETGAGVAQSTSILEVK